MKDIYMKTLFFYWISLLCFSCQNGVEYKGASTFTFDDFGPAISLKAVNVDFDEPILLPGRFILIDSILLVHNKQTEFLLYKYNIRTKKKIGEALSFGSGPNELLGIKNIQKTDSAIYITDNQKMAIFEYDPYELCHNEDIMPRKIISIKEYSSGALCIPGGYVSMSMNPTKKRLSFFNLLGEELYSKGEYPSYGETLTDIERQESFVSGMTVNMSDGLIYILGMQTDLMEIYNLEGDLVKRVHGPEQFFPHIKEISMGDGNSRISSISGESRDAYFSPIAIGDKVYVSYSGSYRIPGEISPVTHILVFDKEGTPEKRYVLSEPIIMFTVDPDSSCIYATSSIPEYHLIKFELI